MRIWLLPSVLLKERDRLPEIPAIYYACCNGIVLYVGRTKNLKERWNDNFGHGDHHMLRSLSHYRNVRLYYWRRPNWRLAHDEAVEIERLKPILNRRKEEKIWWISIYDVACDLMFGVLVGAIVFAIGQWIL